MACIASYIVQLGLVMVLAFGFNEIYTVFLLSHGVHHLMVLALRQERMAAYVQELLSQDRARHIVRSAEHMLAQGNRQPWRLSPNMPSPGRELDLHGFDLKQSERNVLYHIYIYILYRTYTPFHQALKSFAMSGRIKGSSDSRFVCKPWSVESSDRVSASYA